MKRLWTLTATIVIFLLLSGPTLASAALTDAEGKAIESGEAMETAPNNGRWAYTATAAVSTGTTVRPSLRSPKVA